MINGKPVLELLASIDDELASLDIYRQLISNDVEKRRWDKKFNQLLKVQHKLLDLMDSLMKYNMT
jgi:hypothetical protein